MNIRQSGLVRRGGGFKSRSIPELENTLNQEGKDGWRLCEIVQPAAAFGEATAVIAIFEKIIENPNSHQ